jgi:uncharacterized protein YcbX
MPSRMFFNIAVVHLLTTPMIERLPGLYPDGRFEIRRFAPTSCRRTAKMPTLWQSEWIGRTVAIGGNVRLAITEPCPRCVMSTLPQGDLPGN